jgi:hypothetical protein
MLSHLKERHLQPERYQFHYDEEVACFYLFNLSGQIVGYQQYRPNATKERKNDSKQGRYYTYIKDRLGVWGLETFHYRNDILFITEGIFDAVRIHNYNLPAIAALACHPLHIAGWLNCIPRYIVGICDDDKAGRKLSSVCHTSIRVVGEHDLGDAAEETVRKILTDFL